MTRQQRHKNRVPNKERTCFCGKPMNDKGVCDDHPQFHITETGQMEIRPQL
jgi:hypothetical protein